MTFISTALSLLSSLFLPPLFLLTLLFSHLSSTNHSLHLPSLPLWAKFFDVIKKKKKLIDTQGAEGLIIIQHPTSKCTEFYPLRFPQFSHQRLTSIFVSQKLDTLSLTLSHTCAESRFWTKMCGFVYRAWTLRHTKRREGWLIEQMQDIVGRLPCNLTL